MANIKIPTLKEQLDSGLAEVRKLRSGKLSFKSLRRTVVEAPGFGAQQVKVLRAKLNVSQSVLAIMLQVSPKTVQAWEIGNGTPSGPAQVLLGLLEKKPALRKELIPG